MSVTIYHNPRCSKSRQTLALLEENGIKPDIVEYLQTPPDPTQLAEILTKLGLRPRELMRTGEADYKTAIEQLSGMNDTALTAWLSTHPTVIQRPIVMSDLGACIGRPPENVLEII
jgi:arsenate reductase